MKNYLEELEEQRIAFEKTFWNIDLNTIPKGEDRDRGREDVVTSKSYFNVKELIFDLCRDIEELSEDNIEERIFDIIIASYKYESQRRRYSAKNLKRF